MSNFERRSQFIIQHSIFGVRYSSVLLPETAEVSYEAEDHRRDKNYDHLPDRHRLCVVWVDGSA